MRFTVTFHGPFRVSTGSAAPGVDASVDPTLLIPESSVKGVMRAAAISLGVSDALVSAVFGTPSQSSAWAWLPFRFDDDTTPVIERSSRVPRDADSGVAEAGALLLADQVWASSGSFDVIPRGPLTEEERARHAIVLSLAARAVRSFGATRNRGLGWVTIASEIPPTGGDARAVLGEVAT